MLIQFFCSASGIYEGQRNRYWGKDLLTWTGLECPIIVTIGTIDDAQPMLLVFPLLTEIPLLFWDSRVVGRIWVSHMQTLRSSAAVTRKPSLNCDHSMPHLMKTECVYPSVHSFYLGKPMLLSHPSLSCPTRERVGISAGVCPNSMLPARVLVSNMVTESWQRYFKYMGEKPRIKL